MKAAKPVKPARAAAPLNEPKRAPKPVNRWADAVEISWWRYERA